MRNWIFSGWSILQDETPVAYVLTTSDDHIEDIKIGNLISAAPDLLAACKEFVRKVDAGQARSSASYSQMKAAIEKAET